jgi:hypothetical protein
LKQAADQANIPAALLYTETKLINERNGNIRHCISVASELQRCKYVNKPGSAQAVSRRLLMPEARVRTHDNPVVFVVDKVALGQVFF